MTAVEWIVKALRPPQNRLAGDLDYTFVDGCRLSLDGSV